MSVPARVLVVAIGALLIVVGLGAATVLRGGGDEPPPAPGPSPSPTPAVVQPMLLIQVLDAQQYAADNIVVGARPPGEDQGTTLLTVPASLLVPVNDDTVTLGMTPSILDTLAGVNGVQEALSLRIDAGLRIDRLAFAGWVDGVDGVWLTVPEEVELPSADNGPPRVIKPGWQRLEGVDAADYALLRRAGEEPQERAERFAVVFDAAVQRLPNTPERMRQFLTSLGSSAQTTVPTEELVPLLLQVRQDVRFDRLRSATLPVEVIREGVRPASIPAPEADALLDDLFPEARLGVTG